MFLCTISNAQHLVVEFAPKCINTTSAREEVDIRDIGCFFFPKTIVWYAQGCNRPKCTV